MAAVVPKKAKVAVIYYSMYNHVGQLAKEVVAGAKSTGADVKLFQIKETLSPEITAKMHAPPQDPSIPFVTAADLPAFDAFIFGTPTRYGQPSAQWKTFFDSTGGLWSQGALSGKIGSMFIATATQGGGQEQTCANMISNFVVSLIKG
jgi:NAD(P)H dehydrogenase (quinone)